MSVLRPFEELADAGRVRRYRAVAIAALQEYPFTVARVVPVREGECMIFRVDARDGARYALRIHNPGYQDEASVRSELAWLTSLREELAVPEPVPNRSGDTVTMASARGIDGPRSCDLLRWQEGRFAHRQVGPTAMRRVGTFLARMHAHPFTPPPWFRRQRWDGEHIFGRRVDDALRALPFLSREDMEIVERAVERDRAARAAIGESPQTFGIIHADLTQGNLLFHGGEVRAIDFDDCGFGHHLYDIAVSLSRTVARDDHDELRAALLEGYREVRALPAEHEQHIGALIAARRFSLMAWQVLRWGDPDVSGYITELRRLVAREM